MKTKKIVADTMPLALKKVRQELGDNAIIVNTKAIKTGGVFGLFTKQKYEVTAYSVDKNRPDPPTPQRVAFQEKQKNPRQYEMKKYEEQIGDAEQESSVFHRSPQKLYNVYSQTKTSSPQEPQASIPKESIPVAPKKQPSSPSNETQLLEELQDMRKMMMTFMMSNKQGEAMPANLSAIIDRLKANGVNESVIEHIMAGLLKHHENIADLDENIARKEILALIKSMIEKRLPASNTIQETTRMINVIGPTGVGKTTSIAKLATEQVLKQKRRVAMITTDVYRIAAVEQLKTYAGILNVPIEVVRSSEELEVSLQKLRNYDLIYMDTTGRNYKEVQHRESINEFLNHPLESDNYLVLSLTTKFEDMKILLDEFLESPVKKLILTKFDETSSYGSILNIAYQYPYQLAYITNGQSVPEDITGIDAAMIAEYLVGEEK
jgi:flagellar biosynthesis protein FlhF